MKTDLAKLFFFFFNHSASPCEINISVCRCFVFKVMNDAPVSYVVKHLCAVCFELRSGEKGEKCPELGPYILKYIFRRQWFKSGMKN